RVSTLAQQSVDKAYDLSQRLIPVAQTTSPSTLNSATFGSLCVPMKILMKALLVAPLILLFQPSAVSQSKPVLIQPELQLQRIEGFGISIGSGSAAEIAILSGIERARLLDLLFGVEGARINILRTEISWAGKRLPLTHPLYLRGFVYNFGDEESESSQYLVIREAQKRSELIVNGCVWSPPSSWKT